MVEVFLWLELHSLPWVCFVCIGYQYWSLEKNSYSWVAWASDLEKGLEVPCPCQFLQQVCSWLCWYCCTPYWPDRITFWVGVDWGWAVFILQIESSFGRCPNTSHPGPHQECFIYYWDWHLWCCDRFSTFARLGFQTAAGSLLLKIVVFCII